MQAMAFSEPQLGSFSEPQVGTVSLLLETAREIRSLVAPTGKHFAKRPPRRKRVRKVAGAAALATVGLSGGVASASTLVIRPGQTLWGIAQQNGTTYSELALLNRIPDPNFILAGATLTLPGTQPESTPGGGQGGASQAPSGNAGTNGSQSNGDRVVVQPGDTLSQLALQFGTTVASIVSANGISDPNFISVGSTLTVPTLATSPSLVSTTPTTSGLPAQLVSDPSRLALVPVFQKWASAYHVPLALLEALDWWESGWQQNVVSRTGAIGIGQLEPATVEFTSKVLLGDPSLNPWSASDNIQMSARFLHYLLDRTNNSLTSAVAAYYEGLANEKAGFVDPSTPAYVAGVMAFTQRFAAAGA